MEALEPAPRSRAAQKAARERSIEARRHALAESETYLRAQLAGDEEVRATATHAILTGRRLLFAWKLYWSPHAGEWAHDAIAFDEVTLWRLGRRHDERPLMLLCHPDHIVLGWVPARRFLWFRWGNATGEVTRGRTMLSFGRRSDPLLGALESALLSAGSPRGEPFVEQIPGTREERPQLVVLRGSR